MKTKNLTISDATKEELLEYFFVPEGMGGGFTITGPITAPQDRFLLWLKTRRAKECLDAMDKATDKGLVALKESVRLTKKAATETDVDKLISLSAKANELYKTFEKYDKEAQMYMKKADEVWE